MKRHVRLVLSGVALVALALVLYHSAPVNLQAAAANQSAPAWELKDVNGKPVKSSDFKGKVVILDFWATWCPPCRQEIPGFISLQQKYGKEGLTVVGVALDAEGAKVVAPFIKKNGINYPIVLGNEQVTRAFGGIEAIPTTFIIDREGNIVSKHVGFVPEATFEKEIKPLLKSS